MTRARILADYVAGGTTAAEFDYLDGVTSNVQTQLDAKVSNATHTGDVTGGTALTIANDAVDIAMLSATGTAGATTYLRGDNAWSPVYGTFAGMSYNSAAGPCDGNAIGMAGDATYTAIIGAAYTTINHIVMGYTITTDGSSNPTVTKLWNHSGNLILDVTGTTVYVSSLHAVFPQPWAMIWRTG